MSKRCAYCGDHGNSRVDFTMDGHPACLACRTQFGEDADRDRLARVREYRAERRGLLNRILAFSRS